MRLFVAHLTRRQNHWLDALYNAAAAGHLCGVRLIGAEPKPAPRHPRQTVYPNREFLTAGLAWHFKRYNDDPELAALEDEARRERRELWADANSIPPWDWRQNERERRREETASQRDPA